MTAVERPTSRKPASARDRVRLDRWLWAARLYASRTLAARAIAGGKAQLNGHRAKPGSPVAVGDQVRVRKGPYTIELVVRALSERRGPAREAALLYAETPESLTARETLALALASQPVAVHQGKGRPTKRDRRRLERLVDEWPD